MGCPDPSSADSEDWGKNVFAPMELAQLDDQGVCAGVQDEGGSTLPVSTQGSHQRGEEVGGWS